MLIPVNFSAGEISTNNFHWRDSDDRVICPDDPNPTDHYNIMKLLLTALCASFMVIPAAFASDCEKGKCEKGKCDKEKQEEGTLAECDKCKKAGEEKKEEGTLAECDKCKKAGEEKKEEGTLA